ncbi:MAG: arylsulfatase [Pirellulales bacterium]|nr:arylsulfatase [Pirellulales bacterium]
MIHRTTRPTLLAITAGLLFASPAVLQATDTIMEPAATTGKPNVIVILTDDQGYGDLSCHGNPILKTPNLDRLHAESVRFTDFHVAPMCAPTRGQLISGMDCLRNGAMNVSSGRVFLRRGLPTMADMFAAGGYQCGQFGKWHLGDNYPYRPHDRGFHEAIYYPSSHIGSAPDYWNNDYFDDTYWHNGAREKFSGYTTDVFFGEAIRWMAAQAAKKKPFFCYLATAAAHGPLFVPEKYREPYQDQKPDVARFFGMIANIDENVGRLETFLVGNGLRDNTIVIFMTDNGGTVGVPVFNAGMKGRKVTLWEGGHRVPCFIRWPVGNLREPGDVNELTQVQDILPTLAELCALPTLNARFDGMSLARLLRGEADTLPERMLAINYSRMDRPVPVKEGAAVLWNRWRLLQGRELYDLSTDPSQQHNVLDQFHDVAEKMQNHLDAWWCEVEPTINDFGAIVIGSDAENPSQLSPADWQDSFLDQGHQVRVGLRRNGVWNVMVDRAGEYEFELRRWPREADTALAAGLPAYQHADGQFIPGAALPIAGARLKIANFNESRAVEGDAKCVAFAVTLAAGPAQLQTWFSDDKGHEVCGAYYVYVTRK